MTNAEKYVAAAYLVVFVVVLAYVLIIATKLQRLERELAELTELARARDAEEPQRKAVAVG
jgi:CcmD family protein